MASPLISHDARLGIFRIRAGRQEYVVGLYHGKWPVLVHWGSPLGDLSHHPDSFVLDAIPAQPREYSIPGTDPGPPFSLNRLPLEYPYGEAGDFRPPAFKAYELLEGGGTKPALDLVYESHRIHAGLAEKVPEAEGVLPGGRVPLGAAAETLEIALSDAVTGLRVLIHYTVFSTADSVLLRNVTFVNANPTNPIRLARAYSFSVDIMSSSSLDRNTSGSPPDVICTRGSWAREFSLVREPVASHFSTRSRNGISSHQSWPGIYLCDSSTTEYAGDAWAFAVAYSGDWTLSVERDEDEGVRVQGGLNAEVASWTLAPGAKFSAPEAVLAKSDRGLTALSQMLHDHVRYSVIPPQYAERVRPILCNNWEATYFDFDQAKLEKIADKAADLGIELFVLDDGWFGKRDSDNSSLGDWFVDRRKLPGGLAPLADRINARGVSFGLWFEPEMVSPDSDLYRAHPDWCLSFAGRPRTEGRNQLILDMSLPQVRDHLFDAISAVLRSARISYCKVDSNRQFAHSGPAEAWGSERDARYEGYRHRHVLGVYTLFFRLTSAFPDIIWEGCAGGGGRSDYALMSFFGQYWISDDTDAVARLEIQHGASLFLPAMVMSSHVSAVPNHQTGRQTSLRARTAVAMAGVLGYELDLTKMPAKEWDEVARDVAWFKERRHIVQLGDMFRLRSPYGSHAKSNEVAVMFVTKDRSEAMVLHYRPSGSANQKDATVRLHGLDADARYSLDYYYGGARRIMSGQELMARGLVAPYRRGDVAPVVVHLKRDSRAGRL